MNALPPQAASNAAKRPDGRGTSLFFRRARLAHTSCRPVVDAVSRTDPFPSASVRVIDLSVMDAPCAPTNGVHDTGRPEFPDYGAAHLQRKELVMTPATQKETSPTLRLLPDPPLDYEDYRDRKRQEREDRLDRFERESDPRYA
jgi:hypothetical protein